MSVALADRAIAVVQRRKWTIITIMRLVLLSFFEKQRERERELGRACIPSFPLSLTKALILYTYICISSSF